MARTMLLIVLLFSFSFGWAQHVLVLQKKEKRLRYFWANERIALQLRSGQWLAGSITKITSDSFYLNRESIRYHLAGTDTVHFGNIPIAINDVAALPTKKELIVYEQDQARVILGHEKFVWIRNGFLFQVVGAGYIGLNVGNDLIDGSPPFAKNRLPGLGIAAGLFLLGTWMHARFDPYIHLGKKYQLHCVLLSGRNGKLM